MATSRQGLPVERRVTGNCHARCGAGEKPEAEMPGAYLSLFGKIPGFDRKIATFRSVNISAVIVVQSPNQIETLYEKAYQDIMDNVHQTIFIGSGGQGDKAATAWVSKALGTKTIQAEQSSVRSAHGGYNMFGFDDRTVEHSYSASQRSLMTQDEVYRLPPDECIVFIKGQKPFRDRKIDIDTCLNFGSDVFTVQGEHGRKLKPEFVFKAKGDRAKVRTVDSYHKGMALSKEVDEEQARQRIKDLEEDEKYDPPEKAPVMPDMRPLEEAMEADRLLRCRPAGANISDEDAEALRTGKRRSTARTTDLSGLECYDAPDWDEKAADKNFSDNISNSEAAEVPITNSEPEEKFADKKISDSDIYPEAAEKLMPDSEADEKATDTPAGHLEDSPAGADDPETPGGPMVKSESEEKFADKNFSDDISRPEVEKESMGNFEPEEKVADKKFSDSDIISEMEEGRVANIEPDEKAADIPAGHIEKNSNGFTEPDEVQTEDASEDFEPVSTPDGFADDKTNFNTGDDDGDSFDDEIELDDDEFEDDWVDTE